MLEQAFMKVKMFFPFSKIKIFVSHLHPSPSPIKDTLYNAPSKSGRRRVVLVGLHQACRSLKNVRVGIASPSNSIYFQTEKRDINVGNAIYLSLFRSQFLASQQMIFLFQIPFPPPSFPSTFLSRFFCCSSFVFFYSLG